MDSLHDDFNETETREFITDALKAKGWKLGFNMRYEYKITDGRVQIEEEEIPFEVPESWCWCRLGDLGDFVRGSGIKRDETRSEVFPCIRYGEMYTKYKTVINETVSFVDKKMYLINAKK